MADVAALSADGAKKPPELDEVMLAMDVVDTLRRNENVALQELGQEGRDDALKAQLRRIYEGQGLVVTDSILNEGIRALKESRFVYTPTGSAGSRRIAGLWARRGAVGKWFAAMIVAAGSWIGWGAYQDAQTQHRVETERVEITQTLPQQLQKVVEAASAEARTEDAKERVDELRADGAAAIARSDVAAARAAIASLGKLREQLVQTYVLRVVSRPGEPSAAFRIPNANNSARNYYVIVEALAPDGKALPMSIRSEENGMVKTVTKWGIRVSQQTIDAVRRDKQDDGIVQNNIVGRKLRGALKPVYDMPVMNGAITEW